MISVCTMMRDADGYLDFFFEQIEWLRRSEDVLLTIVEGDSTDGTYDLLEPRMEVGDKLIKLDTGGPYWPSTDNEDRWRQLAKVGNAALDAAPIGMPRIWVESDLIWDDSVMLGLLADLDQCPAVAPLSLKNDRFYDIWGHRGMDGVRFDRDYPWHRDVHNRIEKVAISSAGSCVVMRAEVAEHARMGETDCIVGLGRSIYDNGGSLWLDPKFAVMHP